MKKVMAGIDPFGLAVGAMTFVPSFTSTVAAVWLTCAMAVPATQAQPATSKHGPLQTQQQFEDAFVGTWVSRQFSCNMLDFFGVTNLTLTIYRVQQTFTDTRTGRAVASVRGDLLMFRGGGQPPIFSDANPSLVDDHEITFGIPATPDCYNVNYSFEGDVLVLSRKKQGEYLEAKLERVSRSPGERPKSRP